MEITIRMEAPELCAAIKDLAGAMRQRYTAPAIQFPQPQDADPAPAEAAVNPATAPTPRKRRTKAEMEADAAREAQADQAPLPPPPPLPPVQVEVKDTAQEQVPLTVAGAPSPASTASTAYPTPTDLASLKAIAVSHATDIAGGADHVKFALGKFNTTTLSLLNPALYGQFATALWQLRTAKG